MESRGQLRAELSDAIARVRRQIDINIRTSVVGDFGPRFGRTATDELEVELARLEDALANLDSDA